MTRHGPPQRPDVLPAQGTQQSQIEEAIGALETIVRSGKDTAFLWTGGKESLVIADLLLYAVGDAQEVSPVPFVTIDTGNHFSEMYDFRDEYVSPTGDRGAETVGPPTGISEAHVLSHDDMLNRVINNPNDPRGYHGQWDETVDLPSTNTLDGLPESPEEWSVASSCGALKVVPLRHAITELGFDTLITGRRSGDPLTPSEEAGGIDTLEERRTPVPHTRVNPLASWSEVNVYAYLKKESLSLPTLYTEKGYRHTDAMCCVDRDSQVGEYGEGGRDPRKLEQRKRLQELGYV